MKKKQSASFRQNMIEELLKREMISDQKKIVESLNTDYGIETNQAVVSRDLRRLGVVKKMLNDVMVYEIPTIDIQTEVLQLALIDIIHNETAIVIKTLPGLAAFVGDYLDKQVNLDVIGCLAGENVVFVVPKSIKEIEQTCQMIRQKLQFKKQKDF